MCINNTISPMETVQMCSALQSKQWHIGMQMKKAANGKSASHVILHMWAHVSCWHSKHELACGWHERLQGEGCLSDISTETLLNGNLNCIVSFCIRTLLLTSAVKGTVVAREGLSAIMSEWTEAESCTYKVTQTRGQNPGTQKAFIVVQSI